MHIFRIPKFVYGIYKNFIWEIPSDEKVLYLTFDDGPTETTTKWILEILEKYNAKATFFCVGQNADENPKLLQKITDAGHSVGNHTYNHLNNRETDADKYFENVDKCAKIINSKLFRPPYGRISSKQATKLLGNEYKIIMYSVLTNDFDADLYPNFILQKSIKQTKTGSIVVFHDSIKAFENLKFVLPKYLEYFFKQGYSFKKIVDKDI